MFVHIISNILVVYLLVNMSIITYMQLLFCHYCPRRQNKLLLTRIMLDIDECFNVVDTGKVFSFISACLAQQTFRDQGENAKTYIYIFLNGIGFKEIKSM